VLRRFGYGPHFHRGDRFPRRPRFPAGVAHAHFVPRHLDGPRFTRCGSRPIQPNGELKKIVKTSSGRMIKCWIPKIYLTNTSIEPLAFSHHM
jgi:hypothetical protein